MSVIIPNTYCIIQRALFWNPDQEQGRVAWIRQKWKRSYSSLKYYMTPEERIAGFGSSSVTIQEKIPPSWSQAPLPAMGESCSFALWNSQVLFLNLTLGHQNTVGHQNIAAKCRQPWGRGSVSPHSPTGNLQPKEKRREMSLQYSG